MDPRGGFPHAGFPRSADCLKLHQCHNRSSHPHANDHRKTLGFPRGPRAARRSHAALHRSAPGPRSHLPAGLSGPARARAESPPARTSPSPRRTTAFPPPTARCPSSTRSPPNSWRNWKSTAASSASGCLGIHSDQQGIVHVIGPELGLTQPGMTVVCGDSHTATHGAFGALAFGIGTSEVEHVLASHACCSASRRPSRCGWTAALKAGRFGQGHHPGADRADRRGRRHGQRLRISPAAPFAG